MVGIMSLWLPIVLSAAFVFIASSIIHMFLPFHKNDFLKMPDEDRVMDALRQFNIPPGEYLVPRASGMQEMRSPEFTEKLKKGPAFMMTVWPGGSTSMTNSLVLWFLYSIVV